MWAHTSTAWVNSPANTTGKQLSRPRVNKGFPQQHNQPLCGHGQPLGGIIGLKTLLESNFQGPTFTPQTTTLWTRTTTAWVNSLPNTTGKQLRTHNTHHHSSRTAHAEPQCKTPACSPYARKSSANWSLFLDNVTHNSISKLFIPFLYEHYYAN